MNIALVIERFDPPRGGREVSTAQMASGLARRGHQVTVLCQRGRSGEGAFAVRAVGAARGPGRAARLAGFASAVRRAVSAGRFDVVHATLPIPGATVYQPRGGLVPAQAEAGQRRRSGLSRLLAAAAQPLNARRRRMRQLERAVLADQKVLCLAVSEMAAREFPHYYARSEGVRVVYNGVDAPDPACPQRQRWRSEIRRRFGIGPDSPVFLTIARNYALKGVPELIEAFAQWYRSPQGVPGARLVVVGREDCLRERLLAVRRRVRREVIFVGSVRDAFPWYAAADACVLLSWYDPCSRVVLEAVRWGVPAITTAYNGAAEALAEGAGIVVSSPRDTAAVVAALAELSEPSRRARRTEACCKIAGRLSMDRHVEELLAVYAEAAGRR